MGTFNWQEVRRRLDLQPNRVPDVEGVTQLKMGSYHLPRFIESLNATEPAEDWSRVRSPARARRRLRRGFRQNIRPIRKPACYFIKAENAYYVHPSIMKALRERLADQADRQITREFLNIFGGGFR